MLIKTLGIVLGWQQHKDNVTLLHLFTQSEGRMTFGLYGNKHKPTLAYLSIVEITYHSTTKPVQNINSIERAFVPQKIPFDPVRQCIAMFMAELLHITLRHPLPDDALFAYTQNIIEELDTAENVSNLHLHFMVGLAQHLGFSIDFNDPINEVLLPLFSDNPIGRKERQVMLFYLCSYYEGHIDNFSKPHSLPILTEIFS